MESVSTATERAGNTARAPLFLCHFPPVPTVNGTIFSSPISCRLHVISPMTGSIIHHDWKHVSGRTSYRVHWKTIASPGNNLENDLGLLGLCAAHWPIQALKYVRRNWIVISTLKWIHASLGRNLWVSSTAWRLGQWPFSPLITGLHGWHIFCRPMCTFGATAC